jgi:hypothetical protein
MTRELLARRLAAVGVGALLMGGCTNDGAAELEVASEEADDGDQGATGDTSEPSDGDQADEPATEEADETGASDETDTTEREAAWPDPIAVEVVGRHTGGLVVELFEVRAEASSVDVDVRITNGQTTVPARMTEAADPTRLIDDTGVEYVLVPPEGEGLFEVAEGEVLEGTLSFSGPLTPDATSLTLVINPGQESEEQDRERVIPHLSMDIPLDDGDADDGSAGGTDVADDADVEDDAGTDGG